jgi:hypothetical protein
MPFNFALSRLLHCDEPPRTSRSAGSRGVVQAHSERTLEIQRVLFQRERHYRSRPKSLSINGLFCKIGRRLLAD